MLNEPSTLEAPEETFPRQGPLLESDDLAARRPACFFDQGRICGADCMAFLPARPEGSAYLGETWAECHVLVSADRLARHLIILTQVASAREARLRKEAEDRNRPRPGVPEVR
jgi:hypothetical protein